MCACRIRDTVNIPILTRGHVATFVSFDGLKTPGEHIAVLLTPQKQAVPLVRVHSECLTGDIFRSHRCDCGPQLHEALTFMTENGGILLYLRQEGRGIGLYPKLSAYRLQDSGLDTFEANRHLNFPDDCRDFTIAAQMLDALNVKRCRLLTNNPEKVAALRKSGIQVEEVVSTGIFITKHNKSYLQAKVDKKNHAMDIDEII